MSSSIDISSTPDQDDDDFLLGGSDYEELLFKSYMNNLIQSINPSSKLTFKICKALEDGEISSEYPFEFPEKEDEYVLKGNKSRRIPSKPANPNDWKNIQEYYAQEAKKLEDDTPTIPMQNIDKISKIMGLSDIEKELFKFLFLAGGNVQSRNEERTAFLYEFIKKDISKIPHLLARMIGKKDQVQEVEKALSKKSTLSQMGLIYGPDRDEFSYDFFLYFVPYDMRQELFKTDFDEDNLRNLFLGKKLDNEIDVSNFPQLEKEIAYIKNIVRGAQAKEHNGINILIYGPPGAGKTTLVGALAEELGIDIYAVAEKNDDDILGKHDSTKMPISQQRRIKLTRAQNQASGQKNVALFLDEIEDFLLKGTDSDKSADTDSKIELNRLLEENPVITFWAGNDPQKFHEAVRQRFTFSIFLDHPPAPIRVQQWKTQLELHGLKLADEEVQHLARQYAAPVRMIRDAVYTASLSNGTLKDIETSLQSSSTITYNNRDAVINDQRVSPLFRADLLPLSSKTLKNLETKARKKSPARILLEGKKGSGMVDLTRHLAEEMTADTIEISLGGIAGSQNPIGTLRQVFAIAANTRSFLVLSDPEMVVTKPGEDKDWIQSPITHEFWKALEKHDLPVCVINQSGEKLAHAFSDEFDTHVKMGVLNAEQLTIAGQHYFGQELDGNALKDKGYILDDFVTVRRQLNGSLEQTTTDTILEKLERRKDQRTSKQGMGFPTAPQSAVS
ncbi:MAG: AAA family ATPase [Alphaproteobacteria bacterium]|nr:AAA family ATPase [Alphaproteobacteria bacterium]